jgi:RNA polymerase sigma-70 factor, ECF subfamily
MIYALKETAFHESRFEADVDLSHRAAAGEPDAERTLIYRIAARVTKTCRYLVGQNDAEDMAQLVLIQVVHTGNAFRGDCPLEYWVDRVTVHTVAKHLEKRNRRRLIRDRVWDPGPETLDVDREAELKEVQRALLIHFDSLSEKQRGAVVLHYLYGYELSEIADLLDVKLNAVRSRLRKGLAKLRRRLLSDPRLRDWIREGAR